VTTCGNLSAATYSASLAADGTIDRRPLIPEEKELLATWAEDLEITASSAQARQLATTSGAAADAIAVAQDSQLPLWCDDNALRQKARQAGVTAFSLLDLITVLHARGDRFDLQATYRRLAGQYVADLPLYADGITKLAAARPLGARPRPHRASPARDWWRPARQPDGKATGSRSPPRPATTPPGALITITMAAITGALGHVKLSYSTPALPADRRPGPPRLPRPRDSRPPTGSSASSPATDPTAASPTDPRVRPESADHHARRPRL